MNYIINPNTGKSYDIFSKQGKDLLKAFIRAYQSGEQSVLQEGGVAILAKTLKKRTEILLKTELWYDCYANDTYNDNGADIRYAEEKRMAQVSKDAENFHSKGRMGVLLEYDLYKQYKEHDTEGNKRNIFKKIHR